MDKNAYFYTLPPRIGAEICAILKKRERDVSEISEIRLRKLGASSVYLDRKRYSLFSTVTEEELSKTLERLSSESLYSHLDTLKDGYLSYFGGVRVGVAGVGRYDGDRLYSFGEISSLVYRIPSVETVDVSSLSKIFSRALRGLLIFAPVGCGKTTALRSLMRELSYGRDGLETVALDERFEFSALDRRGCNLDLISGYKKERAIEIALRSLSPRLIVMDELSGERECLSLLEFMRGGTKIIATVHASEIEDLKTKNGVSALLNMGIFDKIVGIEIINGQRTYREYD